MRQIKLPEPARFNVVASVTGPKSDWQPAEPLRPNFASDAVQAYPQLKTAEATDIRPSKTLQNGQPL
jgi:hypothetical protein